MGRPRHEPAFGAVEHRFGRGHKRVRAWDVLGHPGTDDLTFVLVHGLGVSSSLFRAVVDRLRHFGRVVVFDLPGFGGVPHPRDPMDITEFARAIAPGLADLRGRMVLVAPVVCAGQRRLPQVLAGFVRSSVHERFGAALVSVRGYLSAGLRWPLELLPAMVRYPIEDRIADLGGRLVIVRGEFDRLCPPEWAERLLNRSGAQGGIVVADGAAHQVVVDNADEVVAAAIAAAGRGPLP